MELAIINGTYRDSNTKVAAATGKIDAYPSPKCNSPSTCLFVSNFYSLILGFGVTHLFVWFTVSCTYGKQKWLTALTVLRLKTRETQTNNWKNLLTTPEHSMIIHLSFRHCSLRRGVETRGRSGGRDSTPATGTRHPDANDKRTAGRTLDPWRTQDNRTNDGGVAAQRVRTTRKHSVARRSTRTDRLHPVRGVRELPGELATSHRRVRHGWSFRWVVRSLTDKTAQ